MRFSWLAIPNACALPFVSALLMAIVTFALPVRAEKVRLPVPNVTLYPGDVLSDETLTSRRFRASVVTRLRVAQRPEDVVGKVARRTLLRGKPIAIRALREPYLVKKGSPVRVVDATGGLTITAYAMPLKSGALGEVIRARNIDSGKIITGIIGSDGSLHLRLQ